MTKHEVDLILEFHINAGAGSSDRFYKDEFTQDLLSRAEQESWASPDGKELRARVGHRFDTFVAEEVQRRFGDNPFYPGVAFRSRIEEVIHDLVLAETSPKPKPAAPKVNLTVDPPKPKPTEEHTKFAYGFNSTVKTKGVAAVKPKAGIVTLEMNGRSYEYPAKRADLLWEECVGFGLIVSNMR